MTANHKELGSGLFFVLFGLGAYVVNSAYRFGDPSDIGPGFFPTSLAIILMAIGAAVIAKSFFSAPQRLEAINWRAVTATMAAILAFGLALRPLGLVPAIILLSLISQTGSRDVRLFSAVVTTIVLAVGSTAIFYYGLGVQLQPLGTWFR